MGALEGVCIAPNDSTLEPAPDWLRLDDGYTKVASYTIDRGRDFELDLTDGGRAEVTIRDVAGVLDPTNTGGDLYGLIEPLMQAGIARWNPVLEEWQTRFRGFVGEWDYEFDPSQRVNVLTLELVDIYEILNTIEMQPGQFGDVPPIANQGDVFFDNAAVDDRILQVISDAGLPVDFFVVFSGNVDLWETIYSPGESALTAIQECVDAEFPGVSNFYPDRFGRGVFHGRLAKFDPAGTAASTTPDRWDFQHWHVGDGAYVAGGPSSRAHLRRFGFNRGRSKVLNSALATPLNIRDKDVPGQLVQDLTSIGLRGVRSWSKQNLLTKHGLLDPTSYTTAELDRGVAALAETLLFSQYIVDNYAEPRNRVTQCSFRPMRDDDDRAGPTWKLLAQIDIADRVDITIGSPGGGGFNEEPFYVEGVHEEVVGRAADSAGDYTLDDVTLSLDLSPMAYFTSNPFPTS